MKRRAFLKNSVMAAAASAFSFPGRNVWSQSVEAHIEIFPNEPVGAISPNIYGQFTEHIGGVIYDGVWVGKDSKIPNQYGIRSELIEKLKEIRVPVIRWPGGCFADSYDWRDGIGPADKRPRRTNFWEVERDAARLHEKGSQVFETNQFGTNEFMRFCRLTGAEPYVAANLRSLPPLEFDQWVEYCNSPKGSTTLADSRAAAGFAEPFNVRYWGVGNESWGCGGNFTPEEYASEFRRFTSWVPRYGLELQLIGSGPNDNDMDWTHRFFEELYSGHRYRNASFAGWSIHHYALITSHAHPRHGESDSQDALEFDTTDWYEVLRECDRIEQIMLDQWSVMGQYDEEHHVKLVVDEYGPWYREGTELDPTHIFGQQITMRDALATALTLDAFNRNAEKVCLATNAQLINKLNALFLAHEEKFLATPNFHVFAMYAAHQGSQGVRAVFSAPEVHYKRDAQSARFWSLNGSASCTKNAVTLTAVNADAARPIETQVVLRGGAASRVSGTVLSAGDLHAHNTFEQPNVVSRAAIDASIREGAVHVMIPAASVVKLEIALE
jgi:alpha-N-arabinofuranosidase